MKKGSHTTTLQIVSGLLSVIIILCSSFLSSDIDEEYVLAMSYRLQNGDQLIKTMWESHQFSSIINAFLLKIRFLFFDSSDYMVLYLRMCGIIVSLTVSIILYHIFKKYIHQNMAWLLACSVFLFNPKKMLIIEWSNMVVWSTLLALGMLLLWHRNDRKPIYLILCGLCMTIASLAIPVCAVLAAYILLLILFFNRKEGYKAFVQGLCYLSVPVMGIVILVIYLLCIMNPDQVSNNISYIFNTGIYGHDLADKLAQFAKNTAKEFFFSIISLCLTAVSAFITRKFSKRSFQYSIKNLIGLIVIYYGLFYCLTNFAVAIIRSSQWQMGEYFLISVTGLFLLAAYHSENKENIWILVLPGLILWFSCVMISCVSFRQSFMYIFPCCIWTLFLLAETYKDHFVNRKALFSLMLLICTSLLIQKMYLVRLTGTPAANIFSINLSPVHNGPLAGIHINENEKSHYDISLNSVINRIPKGSKVLYLGRNEFLYLFNHSEVCAPSTTIGINILDQTEKYYQYNQNKLPEYVVIEKSYTPSAIDTLSQQTGQEYILLESNSCIEIYYSSSDSFTSSIR